MNGRSRTLLLSIAAATAATALCAAAAAGHEPIEWTRRYSTDNKVLSWKYGGTYPSWVTADASDTLDVDWSSSTTNNSRVPSFDYSSSGAGRVFYSGSMTSPCSGGTVWLACAKGGGTTGWEIHIRNLDSAPYSSWAWYDKTNSCASG